MAYIQDIWKTGDHYPSVSAIPIGGLAIDTKHGKAYSKGDDGAIFEIGTEFSNVGIDMNSEFWSILL